MYRGRSLQKVMRVMDKYDVNQLFTIVTKFVTRLLNINAHMRFLHKGIHYKKRDLKNSDRIH